MVRDHAKHADAALERARLAQLARHEQQIRENERQRIAAALVSTDGRPADDWEGCVD